jgi:hypothetical protein
MPQPKTRAARLKGKNCGNSVVLHFANRGIPTRSTINWMMTIQPRRSNPFVEGCHGAA